MQEFRADEFLRILEDHYVKREPNLASLAKPLARLQDRWVHFCQAEYDDKIASFILDSENKQMLSMTYLDRTTARRTVAVQDLLKVLKGSPAPAATHALKVLSTMAGEARLSLSEQSATTLARTLWTKYNLAREAGVRVVGLEEFVRKLNSVGALPVQMCVAWEKDSLVTVILDNEAERLVGVLFVDRFLE